MVQLAKDSSGKLKKAATQRAQEVFDDALIGMRKEFEESPVTQEIDGGIGSENISNTLDGGDAPRNLYSFIGFPAGEHPTNAIREIIEGGNETKGSPKLGPATKVQGKVPKYQFVIRGPNLDEIYKATPMPWGKGLSWAAGIEEGIPGFEQFLDRFTKSEVSRSGGGVQVKTADLRATSYSPPKGGYIKTIAQNFIDRIKQYSKGGLRQRFKP